MEKGSGWIVKSIVHQYLTVPVGVGPGLPGVAKCSQGEFLPPHCFHPIVPSP